MQQTPSPESFILKWRGDTLEVTLTLDAPRKGRAAFRTNIGHARIRRREIIAETERGETPLARAWCDIPLEEVAPGRYSATIPLEEVGIFSGKACFFPEGSSIPEWPEGQNFHVKVESAVTRRNNSIYTVFPRQFGSFREVARRLGTIMDEMGFRIIQTLPPFPVPTTYGVMGEYGCPFAATDFLSVDPAMAEFDEFATPLDQFRELVDAVHAREGLFFVDLPANHTGWASTLQTHHPDWFRHEEDGRFHSPGAWGVKWADLVELDYTNPDLRAYMADVFLFWCRNGVDGFRCDAGYMIPLKTWEYIVARVREEFPDTVFMLEGLGGDLRVTDALLAEANLDWAYSELFQTYDRGAFDWYLPGAIERSEKFGTLVHFAETHDNDRLAKKGETYARLRVQLAALLSWQGAWGIANGVEWFATEKIDVHGKNDLNWGAKRNMVALIQRLNAILAAHPAFEGTSHLELVTRGAGNTLAVVRDGLLILANLDCEKGACIDWDRCRFSDPEGYDLVTDTKFVTSRPVLLKPGQVLCLAPSCAGKISVKHLMALKAVHVSDFASRPSLVHLRYPRNLKREVVVPEEQWVTVSSPYAFRLQLVDPETGKTLRAYRSRPVKDGHAVRFDAPHYKGDGTRGRLLDLHLVVFEPEKPRRTVSRIVVPPPWEKARARLVWDGASVRHHPDYRTILSNGAGAASQVRLGWGEIASQYDAFLAANTNPNVPSDRLNLWIRTRAWLQREGYTRAFDAKCVTRFEADPAGRFATWRFQMPCGMGLAAAFDFTLSLEPMKNIARLTVTRVPAGEGDVDGSVRIVFRPDLEWRSFHATTKAYAGAQELFGRSVRVVGDGRGLETPRIAPASQLAALGGYASTGFDFSPYGKTFAMRIANGVYHHEPSWEYNVAHPEEQARGQEPAGDLFSPGWISADLSVGTGVEIVGAYDCEPATAGCPVVTPYQPGRGRSPSGPLLPLTDELRQALDLFIVKRDDLKTVIAGYPWFLDWGRDTFIFMRGMIAAGRIDESLAILKAFAAFEENGTLPNIIYGDKAGNRDTTDAQLWFIRCVQELEERLRSKVEVEGERLTEERLRSKVEVEGERLTEERLRSKVEVEGERLTEERLRSKVEVGGEKEGANTTVNLNLQPQPLAALKATCASLVDHYISGTPNGIHVDPESGLVWSPSHFTWMDTNYPACTPRVGYPVEIQALWISALRYLGRDELAAKALASVIKYFKVSSQPSTSSQPQPSASTSSQPQPSTSTSPCGYYDCLAAPNGEPASRAIPEDTIRPNQLFLITLGILDDRSILDATEELLIPGGIRSLNAEHRLYCGRYEGDEDTRRKPAYHNGTVWAWPFPLYCEALALTKRCSKLVARAYLASAVENLNAGCVGHLSENADGDAPHAQKGCTAQAWSDSELLRVGLFLTTP